MSAVFAEAARLIDVAEAAAARRNEAARRTMAEIRSRQFECVIATPKAGARRARWN